VNAREKGSRTPVKSELRGTRCFSWNNDAQSNGIRHTGDQVLFGIIAALATKFPVVNF
jgi:hypothetical protein